MKALKTRGFTLIELLVVIAIIALLAAIMFPVFASVRGKARQIVCVSNMRQIGLAISQYTQDNDELYPYAADPSDKYAQPAIWPASDAAMVAAMPLINPDPNEPNQPGVLTPYLKSAEVWRCPSDTGYNILDNAPLSSMQAYPTSFQRYGSSYLTRTEFVLQNKPYSSIVSYTPFGNPLDPTPPCTEHDSDEVNVLMDAYGGWHGGFLESQKRYNVLMVDGHIVNQSRNDYYVTWNRVLNLPPGCPGTGP